MCGVPTCVIHFSLQLVSQSIAFFKLSLCCGCGWPQLWTNYFSRRTDENNESEKSRFLHDIYPSSFFPLFSPFYHLRLILSTLKSQKSKNPVIAFYQRNILLILIKNSILMVIRASQIFGIFGHTVFWLQLNERKLMRPGLDRLEVIFDGCQASKADQSRLTFY